MRAKDRRYLKFKMKKIKEARNNGNRALARRHAIDIIQYFGFDDSEAPIEAFFEKDEERMPFRSRFSGEK